MSRSRGPRSATVEPATPGVFVPLDGTMSLEEMDRQIVTAALERTDHNVASAARLLGTSRETLRYRVNKYGLKSRES